MQKSSIKKLNEVYRICDKNYDFGDLDTFRAFIQKTVTEIIRAETAQPKAGKFNIFDFVANDKNRPVMECVHHEDGFKVASNGGVLIALKEDYDPSFEGRNFRKNGEEYMATVYPKWRKVLPVIDETWREVEINEAGFRAWLEERRAQYKAETGKSRKWDETWQVRIGGSNMTAERVNLLIQAAKRFGTDVIHVRMNDPYAAWAVKNDDSVAIAMPYYQKDDYVYFDM